MNPPPTSRVCKDAIVVMIIIVAVMAFVAIYANVQRWRRDKLEHVIITPVASPTASPAAP
ncbi:MAG TPA: hypothetical protein VFO30_05265 [Chthoniobacterales bacterium]|nr:hypothetical protein [Chthoniobacterales bacterium]